MPKLTVSTARDPRILTSGNAGPLAWAGARGFDQDGPKRGGRGVSTRVDVHATGGAGIADNGEPIATRQPAGWKGPSDV